MKNMPIKKIGEFSFSKSDIDKIGNGEYSCFSTVMHASNDISFFIKLINYFQYKDSHSEVEKEIYIINQNISVRKFASCLFEFCLMIEKIQDFRAGLPRKNGTPRRELLPAFPEYITQSIDYIEHLKTSTFYELIDLLRNRTSSHYIPSLINDWSSSRSKVVRDKLYIAQDDNSNSYYPIGENVVFISFLNGFMEEKSSLKSFENERDFLNFLNKFMISLGSEMIQYTHSYIYYIIVERLKKNMSGKILFLNQESVVDFDEFRIPIFFKN